MSLARVKVWSPGDVLTADDLNGEFNNVLNNPITLISPTTAAINFGLQAHTGLLPSVLSASSGSTGSLLVVTSSGAPNWLANGSTGSLLVVTSSGMPSWLANGSTGQVLTVSSSGLAPVWGVVPPDGGLSTDTPSTGALYYVSTDGKLVPLSAGSASQILTISSGLPTWQSAAAANPQSVASTTAQWFDDFGSGMFISGASFNQFSGGLAYTRAATLTTEAPSAVSVPALVNGGFTLGSTSVAVSVLPFNSDYNPTFACRVATSNPAVAGLRKIGFSTGNALSLAVLSSGDSANGLYFRTTVASSAWRAVSRVGGVETLSSALTDCTTSFTRLGFRLTSTGAVFTVNGTSVFTVTSSQAPVGVDLNFDVGSSAVANTILLDAWSVTQDRAV